MVDVHVPVGPIALSLQTDISTDKENGTDCGSNRSINDHRVMQLVMVVAMVVIGEVV